MRLIQWPLLRPLFYQQMNACTQTSKYTLKRSSYSPKFLNYLTPLKLPKTSCSTELLKRGGGGGGGVLRISSDRDDQRIFLGLKFLIPRFF